MMFSDDRSRRSAITSIAISPSVSPLDRPCDPQKTTAGNPPQTTLPRRYGICTRPPSIVPSALLEFSPPTITRVLYGPAAAASVRTNRVACGVRPKNRRYRGFHQIRARSPPAQPARLPFLNILSVSPACVMCHLSSAEDGEKPCGPFTALARIYVLVIPMPCPSLAFRGAAMHLDFCTILMRVSCDGPPRERLRKERTTSHDVFTYGSSGILQPRNR